MTSHPVTRSHLTGGLVLGYGGGHRHGRALATDAFATRANRAWRTSHLPVYLPWPDLRQTPRWGQAVLRTLISCFSARSCALIAYYYFGFFYEFDFSSGYQCFALDRFYRDNSCKEVGIDIVTCHTISGLFSSVFSVKRKIIISKSDLL